MSRHPWMPLYVGDFAADTMHLGPTEMGIYFRLILHCWQHGSIPTDRRKLALIAHCDPRQWHRYERTVLQFFVPLDPASMQHQRVSKELLRYQEISNKRKAAALQKHMQNACKTHANAQHLHTQLQSQLQKEKKDVPSGTSKKDRAPEARARGTRLSKDWMPTLEGVHFARSHGLSQDDANLQLQLFVNHWTAKPGKDGTKLDWDATWKNWILRAITDRRFVNGRPETPKSAGDRARELAAEIRREELARGIGRPPDPVRGG